MNPNGFLISKNWRTFYPKNSKVTFTLTTNYGGFRRVSVLFCLQHLTDDQNCLIFNDSNLKFKDKLNWFISKKDSFSDTEVQIIDKYINKYMNGKIKISFALITDKK
ncbi:MAG: hypothetical protein ACTSWY_05610 [Promethearchaeota archaeon]